MNKRDQQIKQDLDQIDQMQNGTSDFEDSTVFHPWQTVSPLNPNTLSDDNPFYCVTCDKFVPFSHFPH